MASKHALFVSYDGLTDPLGQSQVLPYLKGLADSGFEISVISFEKPKNYAKRKQLISELTGESNIHWYPLKYHKSPPILSTVYDIRKMIGKAKEVFKKAPFDIIHCRGYISAFAGLYFKKKGVRFLFDMRGFWPDEKVDGNSWNLKNPLYKAVYDYFKKKEIRFFSEADHVISLTEEGRREIHSWKKISDQPIPISVIPCCADLELFDYQKKDLSEVHRLQQELNVKPGDFVLLYLGSIGTFYMLDEMLEFFKHFIEQNPNSKFLFLTPDPAEMIFQAAAQFHIPDEKILVTESERRNLPNYFHLANASIFFIKPLYSKKASSPTKQAEVMGMGLPVICNSNIGDSDKIVQNEKTGIVLSEFSTSGYKDAVTRMGEFSNISPSHIRSKALKYYSLDEGIKKYKQVYQTVLS